MGDDDSGDDAFVHFQRGAFPAQFFLQVEEGMARFEVPDAENLGVLLQFCEKKGYRVEWTGSAARDSTLAGELVGFPGGRYVAHLLPGQVLDPAWSPPLPGGTPPH